MGPGTSTGAGTGRETGMATGPGAGMGKGAGTGKDPSRNRARVTSGTEPTDPSLKTGHPAPLNPSTAATGDSMLPDRCHIVTGGAPEGCGNNLAVQHSQAGRHVPARPCPHAYPWAMSRPDDRVLSAGPGCRVPASEVSWRFGPSGGPGGQHANRVNSRVEAELDLTSARGIDDEVRALLIGKLGSTIRVVVDASRSQTRNRHRALDMFEVRMQEARETQRERRPTRPGRGAVERRLWAKRQRGQRKSERRGGWEEG